MGQVVTQGEMSKDRTGSPLAEICQVFKQVALTVDMTGRATAPATATGQVETHSVSWVVRMQLIGVRW